MMPETVLIFVTTAYYLKCSAQASLTGNRLRASNLCVSGLMASWNEGVDYVFLCMYHVFDAVISRRFF